MSDWTKLKLGNRFTVKSKETNPGERIDKVNLPVFNLVPENNSIGGLGARRYFK